VAEAQRRAQARLDRDDHMVKCRKENRLRWLESSGLRLQYRHTPGGSTQPITVDELIPIVTTPMHFDGWRHWFACPSCHRRYRIIYGGARFRCRLCYGAKQFAISAGQ